MLNRFLSVMACALALVVGVMPTFGGIHFSSQFAMADDFAQQPQFRPGCFLFGRLSDGSSRSASGWLDGPTTVDGAGHFFSVPANEHFVELWASWGPDGDSNFTHRVDITSYLVHENYVPGQTGNPYDVAVAQLAQPIFDITPAVRYRGSLSSVGLVGQAAGYGQPWLAESGSPLPFDAVYRGGNILIRYDGTHNGFSSLIDIGEFRSSVFAPAQQWGGYEGDSGTGIGRVIDSTYQITHMATFAGGSGVGSITGLIEMGHVNPWFDAHQYPVPGPSTLALLGLGVLVAGKRQRLR